MEEGGAPLGDPRWIHVLLKQEAGENEKYVPTFKANSLEAITIPILEINFTNLNHLSQVFEDALQKMAEGLEDVGIVLTSPRVVEAISRSLGPKVDNLKDIDKQLVFVIGEKTGSDCSSKLGIGWNQKSVSSGNSASLSEVIKLTTSAWRRPVRLIYAKSSLADRTIEEAFADEENVVIDSVIAYETRGVSDVAKYIRSELETYLRYVPKLVLNFIFFSPSGVECFFSIKQNEMLTYLAKYSPTGELDIKYSCIGRTTEGRLRKFGANVHCLADEPSAQSLVDVILRAK